MCYYNGIKVTREEYIRLKNLEKQILNIQAMRPLHNGFEYAKGIIIKPSADKKDFDIVEAHWEFIPYWSRTMKDVIEARKKFTTLNAKGETVLTSKMYCEAARKRRCLVLSSHFYEWQHVRKLTYPYRISVKDQSVFFIAGIYQPWTDKETGETFDTYALLTTAANPLMEEIHNTKKRMPTILPENEAYEWIFADLSDQRILELATYQFPVEKMQAHTIRKDFRSALDPEEKFVYEDLPALTYAI